MRIMGSQRVASFSKTKAAKISGAAEKFASVLHPNLPPQESSKLASAAAAEIIGSFSKTSSFAQCLSNRSVENVVGFLIGFANKLRLSESSIDSIFSGYGIEPEKAHPLGKFISIVSRQMKEDLTSQQKSTESALAAEGAITQSLIEILEKHMPRAKTRMATREEIARAFQNEDSRDISKTVIKNVTANLIDRIIDTAGGEHSHADMRKLKKQIREGFARKFADEIDRLSRNQGVPPSKIPAHIPKWTEDLQSFIKRNKIG